MIVVLSGVAAFTLTVTLIFATEPAAWVGFVQVTAPVPPIAGVVHVHPAGARTAWKVVFAGVFLIPEQKIGLFFIPPIIPGFIFGPLYLILTAYLAKRGGGNINHSAHLWGALYGITFLIVMCFALHTTFNPLNNFLQRVEGYLSLTNMTV